MCFNQLGRLARSNGLDFGDVVIEPNTCTHALYFSVFEEHVKLPSHSILLQVSNVALGLQRPTPLLLQLYL